MFVAFAPRWFPNDVICAACGSENQAGKRFCGDCGTPLAATCPNCGAPFEPGKRFCGDCGTPLLASLAPAAVPISGTQREQPTSERRLVTVLFADLVGFTTLSESRDSEEVRELLTHYFETSRTLIGRYGGTIEKFIGDAVMAVWGTPIATEDDAERAVRAALDLTKAVAEMGVEADAPDLRARAGVLTGEAAVTLGAEGQGMVAGDLVNTASRIQSVAQPGQVFVGDSTMHATEASIVYEDAGEHELKGKAEPVHLHRALRVVAGSLGAMRSNALEAPFVGRDRELRMIKELFHTSAEESKATMVSVTGIAGIGKSRLSWEFEKYIDGLAEQVLWHRGRCLSYGEGVAYWALVDMVKMRCGIAEEEDSASATAKLHATLERYVPDAEERRWVEPRLAHLLALEGGGGDRENLFSAWRIFFERMSAQDPLILVFEDMQWADAGLLDFVEYLMEWSRGHPIFILALARPEIHDRRPSWGAGQRSFSSLYLEPLSDPAVTELLAGLVPGLPEDIRDQILQRAQGVPLYAVETVRMLLDRGMLAREGATYRPTGPIGSLEVPETLHALIAARLDGLTPDERRVVTDGAVLGKSFFKQGIAHVSGLPEDQVELLLSSLLRKEVVSLQADPRSPERGQYGFLQDLVRKVAYDTLSKKERKAKHLAAIDFIQTSWTGEENEIVEVLAAHYMAAYEAAPDAEDAQTIREEAKRGLVAAGDRAMSLAAPAEARYYFEQAVELEDDVAARAELFERSAHASRAAGDTDGAIERLERAGELFDQQGLAHPAARVSAELGAAMWQRGRMAEAVDRMERSYAVLAEDEHDEDFGQLAQALARLDFFSGRIEQALERVEVAIDVAESMWVPELLSQSLNTKALIYYSTLGRRHEAYALMRYALELAVEYDSAAAAARAYFNLADLVAQSDRYQEAREYVDDGLAQARRLGDRANEWQMLGQAYPLFALGEWDEVLERLAQIPSEQSGAERIATSSFLLLGPILHVYRGDIDEAERVIAMIPGVDVSADIQELATYAVGRAVIERAKGNAAEALRWARESLAHIGESGPGAEQTKEGYVVAIEAAFDLKELDTVEELLATIEAIPRGKCPAFLRAQRLRYRGRLAALRGDVAEAEDRYERAAGRFREISVPFSMALTLLEHGELLTRENRASEAAPLLDEAHGIFERLGASPSLERLDAIYAVVTA